MNSISIHNLVGVLLLAVLTAGHPLRAESATSEDKLINDLRSTKENVVAHALVELEKQYGANTKALPIIKVLLKDPRRDIHCKAARVLGVFHADVNEDDIKAICALLKSTDTKEVEDALKALRGLKAPSAVPEILPLLRTEDTHNVRDACRTLAVLANKDVIPSIEPLLNHPDPAVQKDARDAISKLNNK